MPTSVVPRASLTLTSTRSSGVRKTEQSDCPCTGSGVGALPFLFHRPAPTHPPSPGIFATADPVGLRKRFGRGRILFHGVTSLVTPCTHGRICRSRIYCQTSFLEDLSELSYRLFGISR